MTIEYVKLGWCQDVAGDRKPGLMCPSRCCTSMSHSRLLVLTVNDKDTNENLQLRSCSCSCSRKDEDESALLSIIVHVSRRDAYSGKATAGAERRTLLAWWRERCRTTVCHLSPEVTNLVAMTTFWVTLGSMTFTLHNTLIPSVFAHCPTQQLVISIISWILFAEIVINWLLASRLQPSVVRRAVAPMDSRFLEGWYSCPSCQMYAPPRAHHCRTCGVCVLKRDHHCYFTGTCVAFANQRSHVALAFHVTLASALSLALIIAHLDAWLPPSGNSQGWAYLPPVALWHWYISALPTPLAILLVQFYVSLATLLKSASFFIWQMTVICRGQTNHEFERDVHRYRAGVSRNFRSVFGPYWALSFACPHLTRTQDGDGVIWKTAAKAVKGH